MVWSEAENVVDYIPSTFYYIFILVPLMLFISPGLTAGPSSFSGPSSSSSSSLSLPLSQYLIYRVHQIDMPHGSFGSRTSLFNLEIATPGHLRDVSTFVRKCILYKWKDLIQNNQDFIEQILRNSIVSGVLIIMEDIKQIDSIKENERLAWHTIEKVLLTNETLLPIYFIQATDEINQLYEEYHLDDLTDRRRGNNNNKSPVSFQDYMVKNFLFDSHQFVVSGPQPTPISNPIITSLQAKLVGAGIEDQLPTYVIVSHYDSYSIVPALSYGADSNASGLILLLELMRIFSKLYTNIKTKPKANLVFLISGGGKLNYFGTRQWLEENLSDHQQSSPVLNNVQFAVCLESLIDAMKTNALYMYVSKPPRNTSAAFRFWQNLQEQATSQAPTLNITMIHKKINLAEDFLSWEHERFSLKRISAFTLTSLPTSKLSKRQSMLDAFTDQSPTSQRLINNLEMYSSIIGETLARQLYLDSPSTESSSQLIRENLLNQEFAVSRSFLESLFRSVTSNSRSQQLLLTTRKANAAQTSHPSNSNRNDYQMPKLLRTLKLMMERYTDRAGGMVSAHHFRVDSKNPEFVFYEPTTVKMNIFKTKPAAFDVFIALAIILYLLSFYVAVKVCCLFVNFSQHPFHYKNFHFLYSISRVINLERHLLRFNMLSNAANTNNNHLTNGKSK